MNYEYNIGILISILFELNGFCSTSLNIYRSISKAFATLDNIREGLRF